MDKYRMIEGRDVTEFFSGFMSFVKKVINYTATSVRRHFLLSLVVFTLVSGVGLYRWYNSRLLYESEMVCEFNNLSKKTYGEMMLKLDLLAKSHSYSALANRLHIPLEYAKEIVSIEGRNIEGSFLHEDVTPTKAPMYFKLKATSNKIFAAMQPALLTYLNTGSPYRVLRNRLETDLVNTKAEFIKNDIALLDSIITAYSISLRNSNVHTDTSLSNIAALLEYKKELENEFAAQRWKAKELNASVELLYGFVPPDNASRENGKNLFTTSVLALFFSVFAAVLYRSFRAVS